MQAPGLAVVLVGSRGDSATYVRSKKKACADVGIESFGTELPEDVSEEELLKVGCLLAPSVSQEQRQPTQDEQCSPNRSGHHSRTACLIYGPS